jgi:CRP-like cAMP-binding protein
VLNKEILRHITSTIYKLSDDDLDLLTSCAFVKHLKKGEALLRQGEICRSLYFVERGYLRTFYDRDGTVVNMNFTFEGNFTTDVKSFKSKEPSEIMIEAGEDVSVLVFDISGLSGKYPSGSQIPTFIRRLAIGLLLASESHNELLKLHTPTERYRCIELNQPSLLQRVSLSQIASYLGVARETLSRIRGRIE